MKRRQLYIIYLLVNHSPCTQSLLFPLSQSPYPPPKSSAVLALRVKAMDSASSATRGARWILFFNIFQKLLTFGMNQVIVRHSSPEVFGIAAVQLELLLSTLLFLSREGIRLALLRSVVNTRQCMKQFVNMSWLPALLVTLVTVVIYSFCPSFVGE